MPLRHLARALYARASDSRALRRPLDAIRRSPRIRRLARRHVGVLLSRGTTWANVDGALRLLAEDRDQPIIFGPWAGDAATEVLYWAPFVRWAGEHFSLEPRRVAVVSRKEVGHLYGQACSVYAETVEAAQRELPGATVFPPEPFSALVEAYRRGEAPLRPLLKRTRYGLLPAPPDPVTGELPDQYVAVALAPSAAFPAAPANREAATRLLAALSASGPVVSLDQGLGLRAQHAQLTRATGLVAAYSGLALLGGLSGVPVVALRAADGEVAEPDLDLAQRVVASLGGSLTILDTRDLESLEAALGGARAGR